MSIDIEKLEALARKASEGPWVLREMGEDCFVEAPGSTEMPYRLDVCGDDYTGHGDDEQRRHNMEYIAATDPTTVLALIERVRQFEAQLEDAQLQAQSHAQEARTQRATVQEIYQLVSGGQGEPGDWNGAEPVREALAAERERGDALAAHIERLRYVIENDSDPDRACSTAVQVLEEGPLTSRVLRDSQVAAQTAQQIQWNVAADCVGHDELKPSTVLAWLSDYAAKYHRQAEGGDA